MVVPLKLTQFYGHRVPRPRIYPDVKFNNHRVDPPASVNEALVSWASDAHWSMGGLSFKRLRTQGKMEGNVRRLRAFVEEDGDEDGAEMVKPSVKEASRRVDGVANVKSSTRKEASRSALKKMSGEEEVVEATPARKLRRRGIVEESDEESPCVPATEERGLAKSMPAAKGRVSTVNGMKKGNAMSVVPTTGEKRDGKLASSRSLSGSKGPNSASMKSTEGSDGGRLTRSARKAPAAQRFSPLQPPTKVSRARKMLMVASDGESSESEDGLEEFLQEKSRPLRRSTRLVITEGKSFVSGSDSD